MRPARSVVKLLSSSIACKWMEMLLENYICFKDVIIKQNGFFSLTSCFDGLMDGWMEGWIKLDYFREDG